MADDDIVRRLDRLIGILELAHHESIEKAREEFRSNETYGEILAVATKETPAGQQGRPAEDEAVPQDGPAAYRRSHRGRGAGEDRGRREHHIQGDGADLMASSEELLSELVATAREHLRWQRAAVLPRVREIIDETLNTTQMRRAYELCDGSRSGGEIGAAVGTTQQTISNWTRRWREIGIVYDTEERRVRHLISLGALGLSPEVDGGEPAGRRSRRAR